MRKKAQELNADGNIDEDLMQRYIQGDFSAFEALYHAHSGRAYAFLRKRLPTAEEADEVFQKVFMKLHQARAQYDRKFSFAQWLFVITRTSLLDHLRKARRQPQIDSTINVEMDLGKTSAEEHSGEPLPAELLMNLSSMQRQAVELRVIEELSYEEIAEKLHRTEDTVRQLVSRAIRKLKRIGNPSPTRNLK